jgi:hypothetical protein
VARRRRRRNILTKKSAVWHTCYILLNNDRKRDKQEKAIKSIFADSLSCVAGDLRGMVHFLRVEGKNYKD